MIGYGTVQQPRISIYSGRATIHLRIILRREFSTLLRSFEIRCRAIFSACRCQTASIPIDQNAPKKQVTSIAYPVFQK